MIRGPRFNFGWIWFSVWYARMAPTQHGEDEKGRTERYCLGHLCKI
jgi:hypothetical protein